MDAADRERYTARCSSRWAQATNFRRFRTAQQDAAGTKPRTARLKANALELAANLVIIAATLTVVMAIARLVDIDAGLLQMAAVVAIAFGAHNIATDLTTGALGRTRQRLHTAAGCTDCTQSTDTPDAA